MPLSSNNKLKHWKILNILKNFQNWKLKTFLGFLIFGIAMHIMIQVDLDSEHEFLLVISHHLSLIKPGTSLRPVA